MIISKDLFIKTTRHRTHRRLGSGKISVRWWREDDAIILDVEIPQGMRAIAELEAHLRFESGKSDRPLTSGVYKIVRKA